MSRSKGSQADITRTDILNSASELFRKNGISDVSLGTIMAEIGMTNGGFYKHFKSKEALADEVCTLTFHRTLQSWRENIQAADNPSNCPVRHLMIQHLSKANEGKCPIVALSHDAADQSHRHSFGESYRKGTKALLDLLISAANEHCASQNRDQLLVQFAAMVGVGLLTRVFENDAWMVEVKNALLNSLE